MAFAFKLKEPLRKGVRRIAVEQIDRALAGSSEGEARPVWVHETRKSIKRLRSLLRLVRSGLEPAHWPTENAALRDIARGLSPLRDRDILGPTLAALHAEGDARIAEAARWLVSRRATGSDGDGASADPVTSPDAAIAEARERLGEARHRLERLRVAGEIPEIAGEGLVQTQRAGRLALAEIELEPSAENVHELRKAVQRAWRQAMLVEAAWPEMLTLQVAIARDLSQRLGEVQDLSVAIAAATEAAGTSGGRRHAAVLIAACEGRQAQLRADALPIAHRLFAAPPKSMRRWLAETWTASMTLAARAAELKRQKDPAPDHSAPAEEAAPPSEPAAGGRGARRTAASKA
jgi:CHAD domain-containing protein